ncbi:hypothetical protein [Prosthecobacter dejongeii]|uniref:Uncharacterized protein n=1 Tax=Prosthecobacter dejongeii TaxID=48465 RepID=A0A7W7YKE4_9BACT|nr:hypothetical protein [Prosthecobacter dejongeii]MBB5037838.1 hypothetical protein [Prosthecobacter dejongeii]
MAKKALLHKNMGVKPAATSKKPSSVVKTKAPVGKVSNQPGPKKIAKPAIRPPLLPTRPTAHEASASPSPPAIQEIAPTGLPKTVPLTVSVQTSQGLAANGNTHPANLLVIVTCAGWPVTELDKNHFTLMEHFEVPGQVASFSNSISSFRNAGSGAYLLQTKPINGAPWKTGHHLGQLLVSNSEDQQGQAAFKLIVR